jgi:hypothetical protein
MAFECAALRTFDVESRPAKVVKIAEWTAIVANRTFKLRLVAVQGLEQRRRELDFAFKPME